MCCQCSSPHPSPPSDCPVTPFRVTVQFPWLHPRSATAWTIWTPLSPLAVRYILKLRRSYRGWNGIPYFPDTWLQRHGHIGDTGCFSKAMEVYKTAPIPCSLNSTNPCHFDSLRIAINTNMSHRSRLGPYMDPRVFRSTTTSAYHVGFDPTSPRYATTNAWDTLRRDPRDVYFEESQAAYSYRSDRRHYSQENAPSRDVDDLVRRSAILEKAAGTLFI